MLQALISCQQGMSFPCLDAGWQGKAKYPSSLNSFFSHELTAVTERGGLQLRHHSEVIIFLLDNLIHLLNIITSVLCPGTADLEREILRELQGCLQECTLYPFSLMT